MTDIRPIPHADELTPSERVLLFANEFAPLELDLSLQARVKAEARLLGTWSIGLLVGLGFFFGGTQQSGTIRLGMGMLGAVMAIGSIIGYIVTRRNASLDDLLAPDHSASLMDPARSAEAGPLAQQLLAVALLANEQAGNVTLSETDEGVLVTPVARVREWPSASLESRLIGEEPALVSQLVFRWMAAESTTPMARVITMARIMAVVRGFVRGTSTFMLRPEAREAYDAISRTDVRLLIDHSAARRAALHQQLLDDVHEGIRGRQHQFTATRYIETPSGNVPKDDFQEASPWGLESTDDRRYANSDEASAPVAGGQSPLLGALGLFGADLFLAAFAALAGSFEERVVIGFVGVVFLLGAVAPQRGHEKSTLMQRLIGALGLTLVALVLILVGTLLGKVPEIAFLWQYKFVTLAVIGIVVVLAWLKGAGTSKITKRLLEIDEQAAAASVDAPAPSDGAQFAATSTPSADSVIPLDLVDADTLPAETPALSAIAAAVDGRRRALRRTRLICFLTFLGGLTLLALVFAFVGPVVPLEENQIPPRSSIVGMIVLLLTGFAALFVFVTTRLSRRMTVKTEGVGLTVITGVLRTLDENEVQPWITIVASAVWLVFALVYIPQEFTVRGDRIEWAFTAAAFLWMIVHLLATRRALRAVEERYPLPIPRQLVMLRVFGSAALEDLLSFIDPWRDAGVIVHLDGPGTTGEHLVDAAVAVLGRVDTTLAKTDEDLARRFASMSKEPDRNLRFRRGSMQCTGATWKKAIDRMLREADAVVMDLSGLAPKNAGCKFELMTLVASVPLARVTLLVNDDTDVACLQQILAEASAQLPADSPNAAPGVAWRAIRVGGLSTQGAAESAYTFEQRASHRLTADRLVERLVASAAPRRDAPAAPEAPPRGWALPIAPKRQRMADIVLGAAFIFSMAFAAWSAKSSSLPSTPPAAAATTRSEKPASDDRVRPGDGEIVATATLNDDAPAAGGGQPTQAGAPADEVVVSAAVDGGCGSNQPRPHTLAMHFRGSAIRNAARYESPEILDVRNDAGASVQVGGLQLGLWHAVPSGANGDLCLTMRVSREDGRSDLGRLPAFGGTMRIEAASVGGGKQVRTIEFRFENLTFVVDASPR